MSTAVEAISVTLHGSPARPAAPLAHTPLELREQMQMMASPVMEVASVCGVSVGVWGGKTGHGTPTPAESSYLCSTVPQWLIAHVHRMQHGLEGCAKHGHMWHCVVIWGNGLQKTQHKSAALWIPCRPKKLGAVCARVCCT